MIKIIVCFLLILNLMYATEEVRQSFSSYFNKEDSFALDSNWDNSETFNVSILNQRYYHNNEYGKNVCLLMNNKFKLIFEEKKEILIIVTDMLSKEILATYNCEKFLF